VTRSVSVARAIPRVRPSPCADVVSLLIRRREMRHLIGMGFAECRALCCARYVRFGRRPVAERARTMPIDHGSINMERSSAK